MGDGEDCGVGGASDAGAAGRGDFGVSLSLLPLHCGVESDAAAGDVSTLPMLPCTYSQ